MNIELPDNSIFCCYCGEKFNHSNKGKIKAVDHLIPVSKGGANRSCNKRNCCQRCNTQKSDLLLQDFLKRIEQSHLPFYEKNIRLENIKHLINYVNTAGEKLFRNEERFLWYKRRYVKQSK